ncbi:MAG: Methylated-DNA/protein-cysteine methyltransferase [Candidatus Pacebacteria bacterium GW2011_GWB1_47_8]|nr:MAG: Methylated-DNA/protein-cysteine methyltransferase [Candidatus Pacebacteria bacterium GW2011_GWA1_46_10]KKU84314.1 MAG: Methylated-DNA/protein-cysteine methyltransferase [Candidatus Pacebacteria bacterium GW2011_GWB1_47_8]HCR81260.1 cysteine methyltransferase [Candidatus Paceibacterota bacterium]
MTKAPSNFAKQVYALTKQVPAGQVTTYKALAQALGTKAYRAIGQVLRCNPQAPIIPCHRVVASNGLLHGFNGSQSQPALTKKANLLKKEGVRVQNNRIVNLNSVLFTFTRQSL